MDRRRNDDSYEYGRSNRSGGGRRGGSGRFSSRSGGSSSGAAGNNGKNYVNNTSGYSSSNQYLYRQNKNDYSKLSSKSGLNGSSYPSRNLYSPSYDLKTGRFRTDENEVYQKRNEGAVRSGGGGGGVISGGRRLLRNVYGKIDYQFLAITLILVAFGIIMLYSASSSRAYVQYNDSLYYMKGQVKGLILGLIAMFITSRLDYHVYLKFSVPIYIFAGLLLVLVLFFGTTTNGATRWLFGFQPSEIAKFAIIIACSAFLYVYQDRLHLFFKGFCPCLVLAGMYIILLALEPHFSCIILVFLTTILLLFVAGAKWKHFFIVGVPSLIGGIIMMVMEPYRFQRLVSFTNPFAYIRDEGWQVVQSLYAIGSGGFFGVGLGQSRQKYMSLPEPHNDFIFSVLAEELGLLGVIVVIGLFAFLIIRGISIASKAPDKFGTLLVAGIVGIIGFQAMINIAVVTSTLPATGMPLPFFSYGSTALTMTLAEIGIVLNVSRQRRLI